MKHFGLTIVVVIAIFIGSRTTLAQEPSYAKNIRPLLSTRTDVEKLFGKSSDECNCSYETNNEIVRVTYAEDSCTTQSDGWNVPRNTVLSFSIVFRQPQPTGLATANNDLVKLFTNGVAKWIDSASGRVYVPNSEGQIIEILFYPVPGKNDKRCNGHPAFQLIPLFYESYVSMAESSLAELDSAIRALRLEAQESKLRRAFAIYYDAAVNTEDSIQSNFRKNVEERTKKAGNINFIYGGCREKYALELFLIPKDLPAPIPSQTLRCK